MTIFSIKLLARHWSHEKSVVGRPDFGPICTRLANNIFVIIIPGPRVVARSQNVKKIGNVSLVNFGSSHAEYPYSYLALACAIGMQKSEIIHLIPKLSQG